MDLQPYGNRAPATLQGTDAGVGADAVDLELLKKVLTESFSQSMKSALADVAGAANKAAKAALQQAAEAKKKDSAPKPAPAKPQPTGIRPRLLLLPALVVVLMAVPVIGIFLPVGTIAFSGLQSSFFDTPSQHC